MSNGLIYYTIKQRKTSVKVGDIMVTGNIKSQVDRIWETFWTGGVTNPLTVIEQFAYGLVD